MTEEHPDKSNEDSAVRFVPTVKYFMDSYGNRMGGNDQKATRVFKDFEPQERIRRFQNELMAIRQGKVTEKVCDTIIGKKRKVKHKSYQDWASLMLLLLSKKQ